METAERTPSVGLKANAMGLAGAATIGAIMMAPALGIYGNWGPMAQDIGPIGPLIFLAGLLVSLPTAISYAVISRALPSSGSAYTWLWRALRPSVGIWIGFMLIGYYVIAVILQPYLFGIYFSELLKYFNIIQAPASGGYDYLPYLVGVIIVTAIGGWLVYGGISLSVRSTLVVMAIEVAVVTVLCLTILVVQGTNGHLTLDPLNPAKLSSLNGSTAWNAFFASMILAVLSYTGFDVISTVAEETHSPRVIIPRATLIACIGVGLFWMFGSFAMSSAVPLSQVNNLVSSGFIPIPAIAKQYLGSFDLLVLLTALTAATGVFVACAVGASRVIFAMGREGTLPVALGKVNSRYQAPWNASHVVFGISLVATFLWPLWLRNSTTGNPDPLASFVWFAGAITFFALIVYIGVNLSNILFFRGKPGFNPLTNFVVPVIGIVVDVVLLWNAFFVSLWNTSDFRIGQAVVYACLIVLAIGVVYTMWLRQRRPDLLKQNALVFGENYGEEPGIHG
jgi:amino acid transporter